jgi:hypothetical protein
MPDVSIHHSFLRSHFHIISLHKEVLSPKRKLQTDGTLAHHLVLKPPKEEKGVGWGANTKSSCAHPIRTRTIVIPPECTGFPTAQHPRD